MVKLLTGTFQRSIDDKLRVAIPKRFREVLFPNAEPPDGTLYVAPGTDGSLSIYTEETFGRLAEQLSNASPTGRDVRAFSRLFYARAQGVDMDKQGRIRIPVDLAALAELRDEAMLIGVRDHLELWNATRWKDYVKRKETEYDELAERALADP